jgi:hypothetical protein
VTSSTPIQPLVSTDRKSLTWNWTSRTRISLLLAPGRDAVLRNPDTI